MTKSSLPLTIGATILCLLLNVAPGHAQLTHSWVSQSSGDDHNPCSRSLPCRTFAGAFLKTLPGGYIGAIDAGDFGPVVINKSITIDGGSAAIASILQTSAFLGGSFGILVNAGAFDRVTLRNLSIVGGGSGLTGIVFDKAGALHIENCIISDFTGWGISFAPGNNIDASLYVGNTIITGNGFSGNTVSPDGGGIHISPSAPAWVRVSLNQVRVERNKDGITADGSKGATGYFITMIVLKSAVVGNGTGFTFTSAAGKAVVGAVLDGITAAGNGGAGVLANGANAHVSLGNSTIVLNQGGGVSMTAGGVIASYKNNTIEGNTPSDGTPLPAANILQQN